MVNGKMRGGQGNDKARVRVSEVAFRERPGRGFGGASGLLRREYVFLTLICIGSEAGVGRVSVSDGGMRGGGGGGCI